MLLKSTTKKRKNAVKTSFDINQLTVDERRRFVGAFAWLIKEGRKLNPELYKKINKN